MRRVRYLPARTRGERVIIDTRTCEWVGGASECGAGRVSYPAARPGGEGVGGGGWGALF